MLVGTKKAAALVYGLALVRTTIKDKTSKSTLNLTLQRLQAFHFPLFRPGNLNIMELKFKKVSFNIYLIIFD